MHAYRKSYTPTYIYTYVQIYIKTYPNQQIHRYILSSIYIYIHTKRTRIYIQTKIHIII